ncbi:MAG: tetratricopeptide repeat protein, partial [Maribacter sp.]|nr:tetratricopeptide repeat protein [Maribacter sp.]
MRSYKLPALILFFGFCQTNAQLTRKDSLEIQIESYRSEQNFNPKDSLYIDLLNNLGSEMRYFKTDSLLLLSQEAFKHSLATNNEIGQCNSLIGIGDYYTDKGNHDQAIANYQKALIKAKLLDDKNIILDIQNNIAGAYDFKGDYAEALSRYLEGIELATQIGNDLLLSIINENIANLYATQKDYKQAIQFFKKVKRINDKIGNDIYSAETMSNIASVYADMGELEYAMFNINSSIATFEKHRIMDWLAFAYEIKGKTYLKEGDEKWALFFYK